MATSGADRKEVETTERVEVGSLEFRTHLTEYLENARHKGARVVITRNGKPYAALVSAADLEKLEVSEASASAAL